MRNLLALPALLLAMPALAQEAEEHEYGFVSLRNTDFIVLLAFLLFVAILLYYQVPSKVAALLDRRAEGIRTELAEARSLRDEAQALVASFDRKRQEMAAQAERIVADARADALRAAEEAKSDAARAVERRLASAEDRIASAEAKAIGRVRDSAITAAVAAARDVLARQTTPAQGDRLIDEAIATVEAKLH